MDTKTLSLVVPAYNEQAVIEQTHARLKQVLDGCAMPYEIVYVDDGSTDATAALIGGFCEKDTTVRLVSLARNFGHQVAITAGLAHARGDAMVIIDADLQDPPEVIPAMLERWRAGYDVVYGRRAARRGEGVVKKASAALFYRILDMLTDLRIPADAGDFRLIDRKVAQVLVAMPERSRYMRGLAFWAGFRQAAVDFVREPRRAGVTKYSVLKMLRFAADAIVSFSVKPLRFAFYAGILFFAPGLLGLCYVLSLWYAGVTVPVWLAVDAPMFIVGGTVLLCIGCAGEYIARIYEEAKGRPLYVVAAKKGFEKDDRP